MVDKSKSFWTPPVAHDLWLPGTTVEKKSCYVFATQDLLRGCPAVIGALPPGTASRSIARPLGQLEAYFCCWLAGWRTWLSD